MKKRDAGALYVVSTPIGNLGDMTFRGVRVLQEVDLIVSEDTRTTRKLMNVYGIRTPIVSYHEQGGRRKTQWIIGKILEGKDVALVSEAGTPGISDPGFELIERCISEGLQPVTVPGPSVPAAAISVSGLPAARFVFEGFPPRRRPQRMRYLDGLRADSRTLIFFESPRRLSATLEDILQTLGNRRAVVARELTKAFEEWYRGTIRSLLEELRDQPLPGEVTLIVEGNSGNLVGEEHLLSRVRFLKERCGLEDKDLIRVVREETKLPRKAIYQAVLDMKREQV